jgi:hypothetical protein
MENPEEPETKRKASKKRRRRPKGDHRESGTSLPRSSTSSYMSFINISLLELMCGEKFLLRSSVAEKASFLFEISALGILPSGDESLQS